MMNEDIYRLILAGAGGVVTALCFIPLFLVLPAPLGYLAACFVSIMATILWLWVCGVFDG